MLHDPDLYPPLFSQVDGLLDRKRRAQVDMIVGYWEAGLWHRHGGEQMSRSGESGSCHH